MPKDDFLTPKAIAKKLKSRGLGKQWLYCQMCHKQCRDDNGFKCHQLSERHQMNMKLFEENQEKYLNKFSGEFERGMVGIIKNSFRNEWVAIDQIYNDYIRTRCHTRLNGTRWVTLDEFAIYLGESGKAKVENRAPPGREARWFVKYIDKDPETLIKEKKEKAMLTDAEREQLELEKRVKLVQEAEKEKEKKDAPTELNLEKAKEIKFTLNVTKPATNHNSAVAGDAKRKFGSVDDDETDEKVDKKIKKTKPDTWLVKGIVVKVLSKSVGDGKYYKQKGVVEDVVDKNVGVIKMLDSGEKVKVAENQLETVLPAVGRKVQVVNGEHYGEVGTLMEINVDKFSAQVKLSNGTLTWQPYENICKINN